MAKKLTIAVLFFLVALLLIGCNDDEKDKESQKELDSASEAIETEDVKEEETEKVEEEVAASSLLLHAPAIPTTIDEMANQLPGLFAGADNIYDYADEIKQEFDKVGPLPENPTDEEYDQYLRYIYSLVAEDYPNPEDVIKQWQFASFGNPDLPDSRYHFKPNYNIEILLDASGSMANYAGSRTRMEIAKEAILQFVQKVPKEANVSLRVYGHEGTGADRDKELSCSTIEQVYGFAPYDEEKFKNALSEFEPAGWTPLAGALSAAKESMASFHTDDYTNLIYVVSDGIETCDGDPVAVAEELSQSDIQPIINIIGFQTDQEAQKQLQEIARVADGIYATANNQEELQAEFKRAEEVLEAWEKWKRDALKDVKAGQVDAYFDIIAIHNKWSSITRRTMNNMWRLITQLDELEFITFEQRMELDARRKEIKDDIEELVRELRKNLEQMKAENFEEAQQQIEKIFQEQNS